MRPPVYEADWVQSFNSLTCSHVPLASHPETQGIGYVGII